MTYVPGFRHDVFVSYAHVDNDASLYPGGWIAAFIARLRGFLRIRLGDGDVANVLFADNLGASDQIENLIADAKSSALLLVVGSRTYINREFTLRELAAFHEAGGSADRIFLTELVPLLPEQKYPPPIHDHHRMSFHEQPDGSRSRMPISPDDPRFTRLMGDLAEEISQKLRGMRKGAQEKIDPKPTPSTGRLVPPHRTVLLAQATDDQEEERHQLRRYLEQFNVEVLPSSTYPQGGVEFKKAFLEDSKRASLFVQLLGRSPGRMPPDLPAGYVRTQYELAVESGLPITQWRAPDLDVEAISNTDHQALLCGATVRAEGLEAFKRGVKEQALAPPPKVASSVSLAFISTDQKDLAFAQRLKDQLIEADVTVALPTFRESAPENREDLESNLIECQALLFVYGLSTPEWVRRQLRYFAKVKARRDEPPRIIALCIGPPSDGPPSDEPPPDKDDIAMMVPGMRHVDCREQSLSALRSLIAEMML